MKKNTDRPTKRRERREAARAQAVVEPPSKTDALRIVTIAQAVVVVSIAASCVLFSVAYVRLYLDDNCYHIPNAVRIAQHLNPYSVDSPVDSHWFPAGAETFAAIPILLSGSINASNLTGAWCVIGLLLLMYRFAGLWCAEAGGRWATLACVATIPLLVGQSIAFYIDIHLALLVCLSLFLQCRALLQRRPDDVYWAVVVALLVPSLKYSGLHTGGFLLAGCVYCLWRVGPSRRPSIGVLLALAGVVTFTGGFYLRNWLWRGNPLYPFEEPRWIRSVLAVIGAPYEFDPAGISSPRTEFPHPWVPLSWLKYDYRPDMTHDAFGTSFVIGALCVVASLIVLRRRRGPARSAWIYLSVMTLLLAVLFPYGLRIPRYVLAVPVLAALGPAVLCGSLDGERGKQATRWLRAGLLGWSALYATVNLFFPGEVVGSAAVAWSHMSPYDPLEREGKPYVERGHLRIGYTSGDNNLIATLYDRYLTNTLIPLHYKDYPYNYWREAASPEEFLHQVENLHLDYIQIFDEDYPGVDLLRQRFPEKVVPSVSPQG
ncbi:MAG TPA: hypothetical protein VMT89_06830 [Candidatus Acidoferrales bacterium]|nr:hypothetical protein [Candidatus Acidoferrales bacterium]